MPAAVQLPSKENKRRKKKGWLVSNGRDDLVWQSDGDGETHDNLERTMAVRFGDSRVWTLVWPFWGVTQRRRGAHHGDIIIFSFSLVLSPVSPRVSVPIVGLPTTASRGKIRLMKKMRGCRVVGDADRARFEVASGPSGPVSICSGRGHCRWFASH